MTIAQITCTSFKKEQYLGVHNFLVDDLKIALYNGNATLNADTTVYTAANEITGGAYVAGGQILTGVTINTSGTTVYVNFASPVWLSALTARGALIYNASKSNTAIAVLDFGADKTSTIVFTVQMPANTSTSAILRTL